jgi:hypothetical protein
MPLFRLLLAAALLASPFAVAQERPPGERMPLIPHRAIYDLTMVPGGGTQSIDNARGRLAFDFAGDACDGWSLSYRQVTQLESGESGERTLDVAGASFESADGNSLRFRIDNRGGASAGIVEGEAERRPDGGVVVRLRRPKPETVTLPGPVVFTTERIQGIIDAAKEGRRTVTGRVFDGGDDGKKVYETLAVIGPRLEPGAGPALEPPARHETLARTARWPVTLSYFLAGSSDATPVQVLTFDLYENGVSRALVFDYGSFALRGELVGYEPTGTGECRK